MAHSLAFAMEFKMGIRSHARYVRQDRGAGAVYVTPAKLELSTLSKTRRTGVPIAYHARVPPINRDFPVLLQPPTEQSVLASASANQASSTPRR